MAERRPPFQSREYQRQPYVGAGAHRPSDGTTQWMPTTTARPPSDNGQWPPRQPGPASPRQSGPGVPRQPNGRPVRPGRRADASPWNWLLFVPIVLPLLPPLYNRVEPTLLGLPFFYWCQLAFAVLASIVIAIVHVATKGR